MKEITRANIKDKILLLLMEETVLQTPKIAEKLEISHATILGLTEEIASEDFIVRNAISTRAPERYEFIIKIKPKGVIFIKDDHGFIGRYKKLRRKQIWTSLKTIAIVINAIILIILTIWGINSNNEKKDFRHDLLKKDSLIINLQMKLNQLRNDSLK